MWSELLKVKYSQKQHASHVVFLFAEKRKTLKFLVEIANKETRKKKEERLCTCQSCIHGSLSGF